MPSGSFSTTWLSQILSNSVRGLLADILCSRFSIWWNALIWTNSCDLCNAGGGQALAPSHDSAPLAAATPVLKQACSR